MDSIKKECNELKSSYDKCFNQWYSKEYLKGGKFEDGYVPCEELLLEYNKVCNL